MTQPSASTIDIVFTNVRFMCMQYRARINFHCPLLNVYQYVPSSISMTHFSPQNALEKEV